MGSKQTAWLSIAIGLLVSACGPSIIDSVRRAAHARVVAWDDDEIRLECAVDEIVVRPVIRGRDPVTGEGDGRSRVSADEVAELTRDGRLYDAWCPAHGCCGRPAGEAGMADAVVVRCTDDGICEAVRDNFGDCLTVYCSTF